jgi:hypothetical protein
MKAFFKIVLPLLLTGAILGSFIYEIVATVTLKFSEWTCVATGEPERITRPSGTTVSVAKCVTYQRNATKQ